MNCHLAAAVVWRAASAISVRRVVSAVEVWRTVSAWVGQWPEICQGSARAAPLTYPQMQFQIDPNSNKGPSINNVSFEGQGGGVKNGILRRFLGLKLRRQGEGGGSRNPKIEETSFMDVP